MKAFLIVTCLISFLFSLSFTQNIDLKMLKAINAHDCELYNLTSGVISTDVFAGAVGLSCAFIAPKVSLIAASLTGIEVYLLKNILKRPRPFQEYKWVTKRTEASGYSMPSGHAAMSFEAAYIWSEHFPKLSLLFYSIATYISVSRIYYGVHYPSDVLIGAVVGYLTAYVVSKMFYPVGTHPKKISLEFELNF